MGDRTKQSDPILQEVSFPHLEEVDHLRSVATCVTCRKISNHMKALYTHRQQNGR